MRLTLLKTAAALALLSFASLALADPPARVARIAATTGQVIVHGLDTDDADSGLLNWPLSTGNRVSTLRGAGAEVRLGSSAVRLDGDSELEITELDDDSFVLRLLYGGASVRIRNADALAGFVLDTPQARVRLEQPGWVRVEADRPPGISVVSVLEGAAVVDGRGASLTVRAGKRAELNDEQVLTGPLQRSVLDNWPEAAVVQAPAPALRYITEDITGYEELDRYGSWSDSAEYGPLWLPRGLPSGWAPYSDGRWTWVAPWGWTWVDNAPWGYAPSHYGRWVMVGQRWSWAPGRGRERPVWAPALVGWVGSQGAGQGVGQHGGRGPAVGWFPLSPRERFVPGYRASPDYERRINTDGRWNASAAQRQRRDGLSLLPQEQFGQRRQVPVARATAPQHTAPLAPLTTAPQPQSQPGWPRPDMRPQERLDTRRPDWNRPRPTLTTEAPPRAQQPQQQAQPPQPAQPMQPMQPNLPGFSRDRERDREQRPEQRQEQQRERGRRDGRVESGMAPALPVVTMPRAPVVVVPAPAGAAAPVPAPAAMQPQPQERAHRPERTEAPRQPRPEGAPPPQRERAQSERTGRNGNRDDVERAR